MKLLNWLKKDETLVYSMMIFIIIQPIIELDLYLQEFYMSHGILALSTSIRILGVLFLAFLVWLRSDKKIKDLLPWLIYGVILGIYVIFHFKYSRSIDVKLPASYAWIGSFEVKYIMFLVLPYLLIWAKSRIKLTKEQFNTVIIFVSIFICLNIFVTNIFTSSYGSYGSITYKSIFSWFGNVYEEYTPRELTSIGFYFYANPMSGLLFMLFPLVIKAFVEEKNKWLSAMAIIMQMLVMFMLGTKVAAYGVVACLVVVLIVYLFFVFIKRIELNKIFIILLVILSASSIIILPYSPAYKNASFDYDDEWGFDDNERNLANSLAELSKIEDEQEYKYALIYQLETIYIYYLTFPREYYEYYYSYRFDPEFYFDVLSLPFEQRKGGRQFQRIFMDTKMNELSSKEKLFGLGYSRMSQGGIVLEQDFLRQYYVLGTIGMIVTVAPYLLLWVVMGVWILIKFKDKHKFNFENVILYMSYSLSMCTAYYSGHILDEPIVSLFIAFVAGRLIYNLGVKHE